MLLHGFVFNNIISFFLGVGMDGTGWERWNVFAVVKNESNRQMIL